MPPAPIENEYSLPEANTYDVPRTTETPSVENIQITTTEEKVNTSIIFIRFNRFFSLGNHHSITNYWYSEIQ